MVILEHDAKEVLASHGIPVPAGVLVSVSDSVSEASSAAGPWFVKAQVPVGGRGKAGGIIKAVSREAIAAGLEALRTVRIKGYPVDECRIEQAVTASGEAYLSFSIDPPTGQVRVLVSPRGGIDVEDATGRGSMVSGLCPRVPEAISALVDRLVAPFDGAVGPAIQDAGHRLAAIFCDVEAMLLEINPILIVDDGAWVAGDAKLILDENALVRQPALAALVDRRRSAYAEAALKLDQNFDYVELDPDGEIGMVTTGAGLSMQLIDELLEQGHRPFNFCDIRSGTFRGDPARLIWVMRRIAAGRSVRSVLVNIFAGVTHLGELARLLLQAREAVPELDVPMTVRLIGQGFDEAEEILRGAGDALTLEVDLEKAVRLAVAPLELRQ